MEDFVEVKKCGSKFVVVCDVVCFVIFGILIEELLLEVWWYNFLVVFVSVCDDGVLVWVDILIGEFCVMFCLLVWLVLELVCYVLCELLVVEGVWFDDIVVEVGVVLIELFFGSFDSVVVLCRLLVLF